jgi:DNA-binding response OmpR family regulator
MNKLRILIIEDDRDIVDLVASVLGANYECFAAANGLEGLQMAQQGDPDLIICDIMMPVMDGWEFMRRLRKFEDLGKMPVIFLTALSQREQIHDGYQLGAGLYLTKPIDPARLKRNIELYLEDHGITARPKRLSIADLLVGETSGKSRAPKEPTAAIAPPSRPAEERPRQADERPRPAAAKTSTGPRPEEKPSSPKQAPDSSPRETRAATAPASPKQPSDASAKEHRPTQAPTRSGKKRPVDNVQPTTQKVRVLAVDDDPDTLQMIRTGLTAAFEVIEARDGITAIEMAVRYKPDLFVIDGMLPRMTGYQLTMMLRKNREFYRAPIVFISAKATARDQQYVQKLGVNHFLAKPFKIKSLTELIDRLVHQPAFSIRADRVGMSQAYLDRLQQRTTPKVEPIPDLDQIERRNLENILRRQLR